MTDQQRPSTYIPKSYTTYHPSMCAPFSTAALPTYMKATASRDRRLPCLHCCQVNAVAPEIRTEIYVLVASQDACEPPRSSRPAKGHTEGAHCSRKLEDIVAQQSLFSASKQTRNEGLPLFYEHHHFKLAVEHDGCFLLFYEHHYFEFAVEHGVL